jgi:hypothetical protein
MNPILMETGIHAGNLFFPASIKGTSHKHRGSKTQKQLKDPKLTDNL